MTLKEYLALAYEIQQLLKRTRHGVTVWELLQDYEMSAALSESIADYDHNISGENVLKECLQECMLIIDIKMEVIEA